MKGIIDLLLMGTLEGKAEILVAMQRKLLEHLLPNSKTPTLDEPVTEGVRLTLGHLPTSRKFPCNEVHCKTPQNLLPRNTLLFGNNLAPRDPSFSYRNGIFKFQRLSTPPSSTPAYFMSKNSRS